jgi:hypothetical protein
VAKRPQTANTQHLHHSGAGMYKQTAPAPRVARIINKRFICINSYTLPQRGKVVRCASVGGGSKSPGRMADGHYPARAKRSKQPLWLAGIRGKRELNLLHICIYIHTGP